MRLCVCVFVFAFEIVLVDSLSVHVSSCHVLGSFVSVLTVLARQSGAGRAFIVHRLSRRCFSACKIVCIVHLSAGASKPGRLVTAWVAHGSVY